MRIQAPRGDKNRQYKAYCRYNYELCRFSELKLFYKAYQLPREQDRQQGVGKTLERDVRYRQRKDDKIRCQVHPLNADLELCRSRHCKRIIARGGGTYPDAQSDADADKQRTDYRSGERVVGYPRPNGVKALKYRIKQRKSASGNDGICNKLLSKHLKADYVAGGIENKSRDRRRDIEPVVQQQRQTQHTTLGDTGKRVNIVKPKGEYSAAE